MENSDYAQRLVQSCSLERFSPDLIFEQASPYPAHLSCLRRTFLTAAMVVTGLSACSVHSAAPVTASRPGVDMSGADLTIRPQDDLFGYVNGSWLDTTTIPHDKSHITSFTQLAQINEQHLITLISGITATSGDAYRVRALYDSAMDTKSLDKNGIARVHRLWDMVDASSDKDTLTAVVGKLRRDYMFEFPLGLGVGIDSKDSDAHVFYLGHSGGVGLSRKYLLEPQHEHIRKDYTHFLINILSLAGYEHPHNCAQKILDYECTIASHMLPEEKMRDKEKLYHVYTYAELIALVAGFSVSDYIKGCRLDLQQLQRVIVPVPQYCVAFAKLWDATDYAFLKEWIKVNILRQNISFLPAPYRDAYFDFYSVKLHGITQKPPRSTYALHIVDNYLGDALGRLYVEKFFPPRAKELMRNLVSNIIVAYRASFIASWLSPATKSAALAKLDALGIKIGYPEVWEDYSAITVGTDFYENIITIYRWEYDQALARFSKPVDKSRWSMTPPTVNAYYSRLKNEIVFPAGILQPPFFDPDADPVVNYGAIGAVIGHEISHAFDDQGAQYDLHGDLHNWWTAHDRAHFHEITTHLIAQYDNIIPKGLPAKNYPGKSTANSERKFDQAHINGTITAGENAADLNGLTIAIRALRAHENNGDIKGDLSVEKLRMLFYGIYIFRLLVVGR